MGKQFLTALLAMGVFVMLHAKDSAAQETPPINRENPFIQDQFAIGFWVEPPADATMAERYKEMANAGFNVAILGFSHGENPETLNKQLNLCEQLGMKALVPVFDWNDLRSLPDSKACWGYLLRDEPSAKDFPDLAEKVQRLREIRPGRLAYINLNPTYAPPSVLGTDTYDEHVHRFVDEVGVDVLSMDHYPQFQPSGIDGRDAYCDNLEYMRKYANYAGIPFWNFFNTMPYGPHTDPTEDQLRWQIYAALTYGAKGVFYFCYYTPLSPEFPKGGAILLRDGRLSRHYAQASRLNTELRMLGPTLMQLTCDRVFRITPDDADRLDEILEGSCIKTLSKADYDPAHNLLIGEFTHKDGRRAVMIQNYHFAYTAWPTIEFDTNLSSVREISKIDGQEEAVIDDSPDMDGLQLSFDAGAGRLFLLPAKP